MTPAEMLAEQLRDSTPVLRGLEPYEVIDLSRDEAVARGLSSGQLAIHVVARALRDIDANVAWVDATWRARIVGALEVLATDLKAGRS